MLPVLLALGPPPSTPTRPVGASRRTGSVDVFIGLNRTMRRQRRRLTMLAVMLALAGTVVAAHSAMRHGHMGDVGQAVVMCLAVAETAVVAAGVALALGAWMRRRPLWLIARLPAPQARFVPAPASVPARAGPSQLQVVRR